MHRSGPSQTRELTLYHITITRGSEKMLVRLGLCRGLKGI